MSVIAPDRMTVIETGVEDGISWAVCRAPLFGAANGYAFIPEGHPWRDLDYDDDTVEVEVHGGLTYGSRGGWIGFDTLHGGDYWPGEDRRERESWARDWTEEQVADECRSLARQIAAAVTR